MAWILFHQGKFTEAYGYENAAMHGIDNKEVRDHLTAINAVLHDPAATATLHAENQKLRTFSLGPANGRNGTASFTLVIADGKVIDQHPDDNPTSPAPLCPPQTARSSSMPPTSTPSSRPAATPTSSALASSTVTAASAN